MKSGSNCDEKVRWIERILIEEGTYNLQIIRFLWLATQRLTTMGKKFAHALV
ncbi:Hypothetical protein NGAL_HAMBI1145_11400 [Neorhizobium galegae bv. officinalis]|uniref:Uncharacterized protein n=1 Tax=Neorhizobium galegae bv. officinalis TaxID=323656 RepID=A0A0T7FBQ5_NEOGA|nr:Hypothetical protein NGAL_HAMBI1145_11400 [Neorhizobium galegae bv. officinalis]